MQVWVTQQNSAAAHAWRNIPVKGIALCVGDCRYFQVLKATLLFNILLTFYFHFHIYIVWDSWNVRVPHAHTEWPENVFLFGPFGEKKICFCVNRLSALWTFQFKTNGVCGSKRAFGFTISIRWLSTDSLVFFPLYWTSCQRTCIPQPEWTGWTGLRY